MSRVRSRNLGDKDIRCVVQILDGWSGPLTWNLLIDEAFIRLYFRYTRQALHKHERIRIAFELRKKSLKRSGTSSPGSLKDQIISRLKNESQRKDVEIERLLEQFSRWAYNASTRGLDEKFLNRPLPGINRRQTPVAINERTSRDRKNR